MYEPWECFQVCNSVEFSPVAPEAIFKKYSIFDIFCTSGKPRYATAQKFLLMTFALILLLCLENQKMRSRYFVSHLVIFGLIVPRTATCINVGVSQQALL